MEDGILRNRMFKAKSERRRDMERERQNKRRRDDEQEERNRNKRRKTTEGPAFELDGAFAPQPVGQYGEQWENARQSVHDARMASNAVARGGAPVQVRPFLRFIDHTFQTDCSLDWLIAFSVDVLIDRVLDCSLDWLIAFLQSIDCLIALTIWSDSECMSGIFSVWLFF